MAELNRLNVPSICAAEEAKAASWGVICPTSPRASIAAALAFGLSRPYLGVHYPSDVIAGALLGTAVAEVAER